MNGRSTILATAALGGAALLSSFVVAAPISTVPAIARGSGGQQTLAVGFDSAGQVHAALCARPPCNLDHAAVIAVPEPAAQHAASARLKIVGIGLNRRAIVIEIPDVEPGKGWAAVIAAPLSGDTPLVPFSGYTGFVEGLEGERTGPMVLISDGVYVGTEREDADLCGRRALLAPRALDPATLALVPAKLQRLTEEERAAATSLTVRPAADSAPPRLLRASWATSAAEGTSVSNLVDGNPRSVWSEGKSGVGRGEFAVLRSAREIPIASFELALDSAKEPDHTAAPRDLFIVTDHELYKVALPPDAAHAVDARYDVELPGPIHTSCVAIVIESAFSEDKNARVSIAEVGARPAMTADPTALVDKIAAGGPDAEVAAALLRTGDKASFVAVAARFASFDENARRIALDVLDDAPCDVAAPAYLQALAGTVEAQRIHARTAFSRCAGEASALVADALARASEAARAVLVDELADVAPAALVSAIVPRLEKSRSADRRSYRAGLARASSTAEARALLAKALADERLGPVATLDVLRALGDALPALGDAGHRALLRTVGGAAPFRSRFLALGPASVLAASDASARAFLRSAIASDSDARIRAEASRSVKDAKIFYSELARGLGDPAVRVREAAATALGAGRVNQSREALAYRLAEDSWPLVRRAAARSLGELGPNGQADAALGRAVLDDSADVRREVLHAIGLRRAVSQVEGVRERFRDRDEVDSVRAAAAISLGRLCDTASLDELTGKARKIATPMTDESDRVIGRGALTALSLMAPSDLKKRLQPFWAKGVPRSITDLAVAASAGRGICRSGTPGTPRTSFR